MVDDESRSKTWRALLTGEDPTLRLMRRGWQHLPTSPRCKICAAPFHGIGAIATKVARHGQSPLNPQLCGLCFGKLGKLPGGAEIVLTVLFADIRGSTGLAERTSATEFRRLLQRFYSIASGGVEHNGGIVDKFLGDGVMALFIPVIAGENHAARGIAAGRAILRDIEYSDLPAGGARIGAGVHVGTAFVGALGSEGRLDFTALGDTVNVAARLGSVAGPGELLASRAAWDAASLSLDGVGRRRVEIAGRDGLLEVVVTGPALGSTTAA